MTDDDLAFWLACGVVAGAVAFALWAVVVGRRKVEPGVCPVCGGQVEGGVCANECGGW